MQDNEVIIRAAHERDLIQLVNLASIYVKESVRWNKFSFNPTRTVMNVLFALEDTKQVILVACKGIEIVGFSWSVLSPTLWSEDLICNNRFIYVGERHRNYFTAKRLLKETEKWATMQGAVGCSFGANSGIKEDKTSSAFFEKLGYSSVGNNYYKEVLWL